MKDFIFKMFAIGLGMGVAIIGGEVLVRQYLPQPQYAPPRYLYVSDADRGYRHVSHFDGQWTTEYGTVAVRTDRYGFRNPDTDPGAQSITLLVLGDSFTFAPELPQSETFSALLESRFQHERGISVKVYNAGVNGYGTTQEVQVLKEMAPILRPQVVLLAFYMNDIRDNRNEMQNGPTRLVRDGYLVPRTDPGRRPRSNRSHLEALLTNRSEWLLNRFVKPRSHLRPVIRETDAQASLAMAFSRQALVEFSRVCRSYNATPVIMIIPSGRQSRPWLYDDFAIERGELDIEKPQRLVREVCHRENILCIDLLPVFRSQEAPFEGYFGAEGHWTAMGHRLAAEFLAPSLSFE